MKNKSKLSQFEVKSFVTSMEKSERQTVKAGKTEEDPTHSYLYITQCC